MIELTIEEATIILRKGVALGNEATIAQGNPSLARDYDAIDPVTRATAIAGILQMVKAMQHVDFVVHRDAGTHPPAVDDPQGLVTHSPDGNLIHVYPRTDAAPSEALTMSPKGAIALAELLHIAASHEKDVK